MGRSWPHANLAFSKPIAGYRKEKPDVAAVFSSLVKVATKAGAFNAKTKEPMVLAVVIAARCDGCIGFHTEAAIIHGATVEHTDETIDVVA